MALFSVQANQTAAMAELHRISQPHYTVIGGLERALQKVFQQTQEDVHVVTGSLRNSGKTETDFNGKVWEGSISYGGESVGYPHNPVIYAHTERMRGGDHDFLRNVHVADAVFKDAIDEWLKGQ